MKKVFEVFWIFLRLGCTSFGGPIAHLSYFRQEFVEKREWFDDRSYADLVALCQFLPGPASSQVGMAIGLSRAGVRGAVAAWVGFTLPSALLLIAFARGVSTHTEYLSAGWLHGLKVVAVAVVAHALWGMSKNLTPDLKRILMAVIAGAIALLWSSAWGQVGAILMGAAFGLFFIPKSDRLQSTSLKIKIGIKTAVFSLVLFVSAIVLLPLMALTAGDGVKIFDSFFRAGSLVFGGGHVVLPLLKAEIVNTGWVNSDSFMAGYGAAQAVPGPLFAFAAYLGAVAKAGIGGVIGGMICLSAVFLPSFLLVFGFLPLWDRVQGVKSMRSAMGGINAAVVGLLAAALYNPVWTSAIFGVRDIIFALVCFILLLRLKAPSWLVVIGGALVGGFFY